jgi:ribosomal protein S18 acetylase RimI-like enzyme
LEHTIQYRQALEADVPVLANIRAQEWGTQEYWVDRIMGYIQGKIHPGNALPQRILYLAFDNNDIIGFIAGHLTARFNCNGELQWINVLPGYRDNGIATKLLSLLAAWFIENNALKVCVDPDNSARKFYTKHGAVPLNQHWLVWNDIGIIIK